MLQAFTDNGYEWAHDIGPTCQYHCKSSSFIHRGLQSIGLQRARPYWSDLACISWFSSITQSCLPLQPHESQHTRPPCPSPAPGVYSDSCPSSWWCHPAISSSVVPFSSCPRSLPASGSFSMSQLFAWGGQSVGVSASASALPMNTQDWSLGRTGWISLQSEGLSRVFSNTTVQKHQFFGTQLSSQFNSHIHTCIYTHKTDFQNGAVTYPRPSRSVAKLLLFLRLHATSAH